jgi:hypothetical protein
MKTLKGLTFGVLPKITYDPVLARRAALISRLEEQRALAQDPTYVPSVQRWVDNEQGSKSLVSVQKRVRPWWQEDGTGKIALTVRYGSKPMEFEKGKAAILLPNKGALVSTLDMIIAAVRAGELDEILAQQAKARAFMLGMERRKK